jgi:hypothetical protein
MPPTCDTAWSATHDEKPLFSDAHQVRRLDLLSATPTPSGALLVTYRVT